MLYVNIIQKVAQCMVYTLEIHVFSIQPSAILYILFDKHSKNEVIYNRNSRYAVKPLVKEPPIKQHAANL